VEKDNGIPSVDSRASGREKRSQCKRAYPPHGFIAEREKGSRNAEEFCIGKNEPDPSSALKLSSASPKDYGIMKTSGRWFVAFGVFLILCGLAGFLSNPSGAKTALISGGTFGALSAAWGLLMLRGFAWAWMAALGCTGFLAAVFTWRAAAGWMAYSAGEPKLFAASLISLMLAGSLVSIGVLVKNR
jgi:uncharacterized membrane protein (UPF0136 family)